jgi:tRNA-binding EMAP/Myf-like protein
MVSAVDLRSVVFDRLAHLAQGGQASVNPTDTAATFQFHGDVSGEREVTCLATSSEACKRLQETVFARVEAIDRHPVADLLVSRVHAGVIGDVGMND